MEKSARVLGYKQAANLKNAKDTRIMLGSLPLRKVEDINPRHKNLRLTEGEMSKAIIPWNAIHTSHAL